MLVIDDDPTVRDLMERFLVKQGFSVVTAASGIEGLRLAREARPAAITLDVMMPDLDGWTVLAALKGDPDAGRHPGDPGDDRRREGPGYALGATDYMVKPIDRERLAAVLRRSAATGRRHMSWWWTTTTARAVVSQALERAGWTVAEAENGRVALERLAERRPDVIVLDLHDAGDGRVRVPRRAPRAHPAWRGMPVVVLTAMDLTDEDRRRLNGGVERILQKGAGSATSSWPRSDAFWPVCVPAEPTPSGDAR